MIIGYNVPLAIDNKSGPQTLLFEIPRGTPLRVRPRKTFKRVLSPNGFLPPKGFPKK